MEKIDISRMPLVKNAVQYGADSVLRYIRMLQSLKCSTKEQEYIDIVVESLYEQMRRLNNCNRAIDDMLIDIKVNVDQSIGSVISVDPSVIDFEQSFEKTSINYSKSKSGRLFLGNDKLYNVDIFSTRYNDLWSFLHTDEFKFYNALNGASQIKDWDLYIDAIANHGDLYSQEMVQNALYSMLEKIPETKPYGETQYAWDAAEQKLDELLSCIPSDDKNKFLERLFKFVKSYHGVPNAFFDAWSESLYDLSGEDKDLWIEVVKKMNFGEFTIDMMKNSKEVFDTISTVSEIADYTKTILLIGEHFQTDYSRQVAYIDSFEEAMASAGIYYEGSPLVEALEEVREQFTNNYYYAAKQAYSEVIKFGNKSTSKALSSIHPGVKLADVLLSMGVAGVKFAAGDQIKAVQTLSGLNFYDSVLTRSYQNYVEMMRQGVATEQDMINADRTLELLVANKITAYKSMKTITEENLINKHILHSNYTDTSFNDKIDELEKIQNMLTDPSKIDKEILKRAAKNAISEDSLTVTVGDLNAQLK